MIVTLKLSSHILKCWIGNWAYFEIFLCRSRQQTSQDTFNISWQQLNFFLSKQYKSGDNLFQK
jgi:hypothetical protein